MKGVTGTPTRPEGKDEVERKVKPQPVLEEGQTAEVCHKCGGTGFWCRGTLDGRPYSHTGFDCWSCNGSGWVVKTARPTKDEGPKVVTRNAKTGEVVQVDDPATAEGRRIIAGRKSDLKYEAGWVRDGDVYRNPNRQWTVSANIDNVKVAADFTHAPRSSRRGR